MQEAAILIQIARDALKQRPMPERHGVVPDTSSWILKSRIRGEHYYSFWRGYPTFAGYNLSANIGSFVAKDNAVLVEGETDWVFVDAKTGRLRSIPENVIAAFEVLPKEKESEIFNHVKPIVR